MKTEKAWIGTKTGGDRLATQSSARHAWAYAWMLLCVMWCSCAWGAGVSFNVTLSEQLQTGTGGSERGAEADASGVTGRLVVSLIKEGAKLPPRATPNDAPFWDDPQPMFAIDVVGLKPGASAVLDSSSMEEKKAWRRSPK